MEDKKVLASNNSKSKEMLEAIAINKQTENLRKNKIGMLDRAKQILNGARNAKEIAEELIEKSKQFCDKYCIDIE